MTREHGFDQNTGRFMCAHHSRRMISWVKFPGATMLLTYRPEAYGSEAARLEVYRSQVHVFGTRRVHRLIGQLCDADHYDAVVRFKVMFGGRS